MLTSLLLSVTPALAWEHIGTAWAPDQLPRSWGMDSLHEDSLPEGAEEPAMLEAFRGWHDAPCAAISETYEGISDFDSPQDHNDGKTTVYWEDEGDDLDGGVLAITAIVGGSGNFEANGETFKRFSEADIVFNDDVDFGTTEDYEAGRCNNESLVEGVATHEVGHSWGLGHSCEEGDACTDPELKDATMYWSVGACDPSQNDINSDDIAGLTAIYGPYGAFQATTPRYGGTPIEVCFEATSEDPVSFTNWNFGDGGTSTENPACHTYETAGQFTVTVTMGIEYASCGEAVFKDSELGYVVACDAPRPEEGAAGFFEMQHFSGLTYQTVNHSDLSVYGCIDTIVWRVFKGSSAADMTEANLVDFNGADVAGGTDLGAWAPKITFPEAGDYVVAMNVGGPGGLVADMLVVSAVDKAPEGAGCSAVPFASASVAGLLLAGASLLRRRR